MKAETPFSAGRHSCVTWLDKIHKRQILPTRLVQWFVISETYEIEFVAGKLLSICKVKCGGSKVHRAVL
jgi:hypothetical protein